jgi:hypothetical protein
MPQQPVGSAKDNAIRGILVMVAKVSANAGGAEISDKGLLEIEQLSLPALMAMVKPEREAIRGIVTMVARMASPDVESIPADLEDLAVPALMAILAQEAIGGGEGPSPGVRSPSGAPGPSRRSASRQDDGARSPRLVPCR